MRRPSLVWRFISSVTILLAFATTMFAVIGTLFAIPTVLAYLSFIKEGRSGGSQAGWAVLFLSCWGAAILLTQGLLSARRARFAPTCDPLRREDVPALFALVEDLAFKAATPPPVEIYFSPDANLAVLETGGFLGIGSRRVMIVGVPLLASWTLGELRAGIAHELGHFAGGDTWIRRILAFTENAFHGVLVAAYQPHEHHGMIALAYGFARFLGHNLVRFYVWLYLIATRPNARRQEIAADALAAEIAGRDVAIRMLEKVHVVGPLYDAYVRDYVEQAIALDVLPVDPLAGFETFRTRLVDRGVEELLAKAVNDAKPDPFDTHPVLAERVERLRALDLSDGAPDEIHADDERSAAETVRGALDLEAWLTARIREAGGAKHHRMLSAMSWRDYVTKALPASIRSRALETQRRVGGAIGSATSSAAMFAAVVAAFDNGYLSSVVALVEPDVRRAVPHQRAAVDLEVARAYLTLVFQAALLDRGATIVALLGEAFSVWSLEGELFAPGEIVQAAMTDDRGRDALHGWVARLNNQGAALTG